MPFWLTILRIITIVLSLGVLISSAYHVSRLSYRGHYYGDSGPAGFLIFDVVYTWILLGFMLGAEYWAPQFYWRIAFIVALVLGVIFWISAWAWGASVSSHMLTYYDGWFGPRTGLDGLGASLAASSALGAVVWVLFIVITFFFIRACLANPYGSSFPATVPRDVEAGHHKPETNITT